MLLGSWFHALMQGQGLKQGEAQATLLERPEVIDLGIDNLEPLFTAKYETGADWPAIIHNYIKDYHHAYMVGMDEEIDALPERVWFLYQRYTARWFSEGSFATDKVLGVEVQWERTDETTGIKYGGKVDRVVQREDGMVVLRDHKTTSRTSSSDFRLTNSQMHLYAWGLAPWLHNLTGEEPIAVEYDYAITREPKVRLTKAGNLYKNQTVLDEHALYVLLGDTLKQGDYDYGPDDERFNEHYVKAVEEGNETFFYRRLLPVNETVIRTLLTESNELINHSLLLPEERTPIRNTGMHCDWCQFQSLCVADYYGNDTSELVKDYVLGDPVSETR